LAGDLSERLSLELKSPAFEDLQGFVIEQSPGTSADCRSLQSTADPFNRLPILSSHLQLVSVGESEKGSIRIGLHISPPTEAYRIERRPGEMDGDFQLERWTCQMGCSGKITMRGNKLLKL